MRLLKAWACVCVLIASLPANYFLAQRYLLGMRSQEAVIEPLRQAMPRGIKPVVLEIEDGIWLSQEAKDAFFRATGLQPATLLNLPTTSPLLIPIEQVTRINPYPPILMESRGFPVQHLSFGYLDSSGLYRQAVYYAGEADTTPSFFVRKVRGQESGYGDYFVSYALLLSKETTSQPQVLDFNGNVTVWRPPSPHPDLDWMDWCAWEGGSSNGFEEIGLALLGTVAEALIAIMLLAAWSPGSRQASQPVVAEDSDAGAGAHESGQDLSPRG